MIPERIIAYIKETNDINVACETLLIEDGIIDSMGVMELIAFIHETFGIELSDDDLKIENFVNIHAIEKLILSKNGGKDF